MSNISYKPTEGMSYDPNEPLYWDPAALMGEVERVFEVCHGCRMCFKYCDSFPSLFSFIDDNDGDVRAVTQAQTDQVMDECFQCKLCEVQCPYTPRDSHEFQLDFPKLVHRYKAQRVREHGLSFRDKMLSNPNGLAKLARASFGMANTMNRVSAHRWFMHTFLGIHKDKLLPEFASKTFERWAESTGRIKEPGGDVVLFQTCYVDNNEPQIGRDTVEVLEHNDVDVRCSKGLECCGMPSWEHGDLEAVQDAAKANLDKLMPYVDAGAQVMAINPSCSMMLRREYPELVREEDRERAKKLSEVLVDPSEYVFKLRKEKRLKDDFKTSPGARVAYHAPCHTRAQAIGFKGRDLIKKLPGVEKVATVMECCGHDGTYAMKVESFDAAQRAGKRSFEGMQRAEADIYATDCPLAAIQFEQFAGKRAMHPMTVLAKSYRGESFGTEVIVAEDAAQHEEE
ncbi:MAG: 4Fe-4S dicluster domain-containing protein [Proteobacteria bacterium]|nr:4Fe-4S dicluster domain-containing protein [Pseudomonadota bacterium]